ncbi:MAG: HAMP domain-containing histidine kinase [Ruminococcaceae bacterium]|nr:HAMP domain-containing histidine kinase [Oscillospiraceae bacterium]
MSLKHRNVLAWLLILFSALGWAAGQWQLGQIRADGVQATMPTEITDHTSPNSTIAGETVSTTYPTQEPGNMVNTEETMWPTTAPPTPGTTPQPHSTGDTFPNHGGKPLTERDASRQILGIVLCLLAVAAGAIAALVLRQGRPFFGPDGVALMLSLVWLARRRGLFGGDDIVASFILTLAWLLTIRELWGWLMQKMALKWCLISRWAGLWKDPRWSLLSLSLWPGVLAVWLCLMLCRHSLATRFPVVILVTAAGILAVSCLVRYGMDLRHFGLQLERFRHGRPITVREGSFSGTEQQLLEVQIAHEEAIRTAVTGERFKVELIANVSHDLRTPLTAILGYSELLSQEKLTTTGTEQLQKLTQKAGYMRGLLESLFELTKVSSGAVEAKREQIDLIRLLEQTIGLFDDQLTETGLQVRRHYSMTEAPVITDGARMHQVFANLLGNAMKYALPGTRIHLTVKDEAERYCIRMSNIAAYEMDFRPEEITERFVRGDKARSTKGSGIGLAIANTYTASVGGTFRVEIDGDQFSAIVELPKN